MTQLTPFNTLIADMTSEVYHGTGNTFSSSQLKTMLEDPEVFYKKYVTKEIARESNAAFDTGTYFHTAILEPEKLTQETCIFGGAIRRGKEWEDFQEKNKGKAILTKSDKEKADVLIASIKDSPISMAYLAASKPEVSAFIEVYVMGKEVFAFRMDKQEDGTEYDQCYCLMVSGWCPSSLDYEPEDIKEFGTRLVLKVRADALGQGNGVISDLKSTTGNAKSQHEMMTKVSSYQYDLSAALYLDVFTHASGTLYDQFIWIFASKDMGNCKSWKASDKNIMIGRQKWKKAVTELAKYVANGWSFNDELGELPPPAFALDWLSDS